MPTNIEIKAKANDWERQLALAKNMADRSEELRQEDIFFNAGQGRLKLRILGQGSGSYLIHYHRADQAGPKSSKYSTSPVEDPASMRVLLAGALGESKTVRKRRRVLFVGRTRVHFDEVEGLGKFIELEVCLKPDQSQEEGERVARGLMDRLGISPGDLLQGAYADMPAS